MYHWYLLIKKYATHTQSDCSDKLMAGHEPETLRSISNKTYRKLFFLGLIEFTPTALGIVATAYFGKIILPYDFIIAGLFITILLVKHLSKKTPELPFGLHH
jgi:putative Mn2+ efflux pump MntP